MRRLTGCSVSSNALFTWAADQDIIEAELTAGIIKLNKKLQREQFISQYEIHFSGNPATGMATLPAASLSSRWSPAAPRWIRRPQTQ